MSEYNQNKSWLGIGCKMGGFLVAGGVETTLGRLFNIKQPAARVSFSLTNIRFGLGIGGGFGLVALCAFNCPYVGQLDDLMTTDWGVNLSFGSRWDTVTKTLKNYKFFAAVAKVGTELALHSNDIETFRNSMHYLYNAYQIVDKGSTPTVIAIDLPVGFGLEASVSWCAGRIRLEA